MKNSVTKFSSFRGKATDCKFVTFHSNQVAFLAFSSAEKILRLLHATLQLNEERESYEKFFHGRNTFQLKKNREFKSFLKIGKTWKWAAEFRSLKCDRMWNTRSGFFEKEHGVSSWMDGIPREPRKSFSLCISENFKNSLGLVLHRGEIFLYSHSWKKNNRRKYRSRINFFILSKLQFIQGNLKNRRFPLFILENLKPIFIET